MKKYSHKSFVIQTIVALASLVSKITAGDPQVDSWFTDSSSKYARVYLTDSDRISGNAVSTWSRGAITQSLPAYCGVYEVAASDTWTYVRTTGLGGHTMGPWYLNAARTALFPNLPKSSATLFRIPRNPAVPASKTLTGLGAIGIFVDGVVMFDSRDAFSVSSASGSEANPGLGIWNRDAFVNEGITFDPANAHQPGSGQYHYHANAIALRAALGDNIALDPVTKTYQENVYNPTPAHSPILGWVRDGFPIYGPYGYSDPRDSASGVRRMISGFVPRNLDASGVSARTSLPAWAARAQNRSSTLSAAQSGPAVSATHPFGRYLEDNDYAGDLGLQQGVHFDLDEHNGRFCVTPEFPNGTYAYFTSINAAGTPVFPYNVGRQFHGTPSGGTVASGSYPESVKTNFVGGANSPLRIKSFGGSVDGAVTLTWSSVEGGSYVVSGSSNLQNWSTSSPIVSKGGSTQILDSTPNAGKKFYKVSRTALAPYSN